MDDGLEAGQGRTPKQARESAEILWTCWIGAGWLALAWVLWRMVGSGA